jgi:hypothetical protein
MPTEHIVTLLIQERDRLNMAIDALQGSATRRALPAKHSNSQHAAIASSVPARKKRTFTAAQRKQQAERMRKYWAAKKKAAQ